MNLEPLALLIATFNTLYYSQLVPFGMDAYLQSSQGWKFVVVSTFLGNLDLVPTGLAIYLYILDY